MKKKTESLIKVMDDKEIEKEFLAGLKTVTQDLFGIFEELLEMQKFPNRELIFTIMKEVDEIETFLDDYGATHNKKFFYFRELIASIRWINIALFHGLHILVRFESYQIDVPRKEKEAFVKLLRETVSFYLQELKTLAVELKKEASKYNFGETKVRPEEKKGLLKIQKKILPSDLNENIVKGKKELVFEILIKFLESSEAFNVFVCDIASETEVVDVVTEEAMEKHRSVFHQIESLYDTYLKNTRIEKNFYSLRSIRSYTAITLHLLEIGKALVHFYERHSNKVSRYSTAVQISHLVNKKKINETLKKLVLTYSVFFLQNGIKISTKIFKDMGTDADEFIYSTKMVTIPSHRIEDFHIRPIMPVTQIAGRYKLDTYLYYDRNRYNLKSSIEMTIAIPDIREVLAKENVEVKLQGPRKSVNEICKFFREKCGAYERSIVCSLTPSEVRL